jgi:hypothetical protein
MDDPNLEMLAAAARVLRPVLGELVFLGGCTTGLMISDPAAAGVRPTKDVDAITEIASYVEYGALSARLRGLGLRADASQGAPMCRWRYEHLIIDVMPTDDRVLGFGNCWYRPAITAAQHVDLADLRLRVITPVYFLATKLEAFHGRGQNDITGSHDLEDIVAVIDGREEIAREVAASPADVRTYVASELRHLLGVQAFVDALSGFLLPDSASQSRRPTLLGRLRALAESGPSESGN